MLFVNTFVSWFVVAHFIGCWFLFSGDTWGIPKLSQVIASKQSKFCIPFIWYSLYLQSYIYFWWMHFSNFRLICFAFRTPRNSGSDSESSSKDYEIISSSEVQNVAGN